MRLQLVYDPASDRLDVSDDEKLSIPPAFGFPPFFLFLIIRMWSRDRKKIFFFDDRRFKVELLLF